MCGFTFIQQLLLFTNKVSALGKHFHQKYICATLLYTRGLKGIGELPDDHKLDENLFKLN